MDISGIGSSSGSFKLPGGESNTQATHSHDAGAVKTDLPQSQTVKETGDADKARFEAVRIAAERVRQNVFVVSDTRFTIFKDAHTGQYITRYTDLRTGTVTYYPEQELLGSGSFQSESGTLVATNA